MYTEKFQKVLDTIPRVDENGKDIAESTRRNMAISALQVMWDWEELQDFKAGVLGPLPLLDDEKYVIKDLWKPGCF